MSKRNRRNLVNLVSFLLIVSMMAIVGCGGGAGAGGTDSKAKTDFPTKPINLIVPYTAGGASDLSARPLAQAASKILGQPIVVINRPGGGGAVGAAEVVRANPDGYTLLNGSSGPITLLPYTSNPGYKTEDFTPIVRNINIPVVFAVEKNSKINSLKDLVEFAKKNPGQVKISSPGAGTSHHIAIERFAKMQDIKVTHVPYDGASPAVSAVLGNKVDATCVGLSEIYGQFKNGTVKVLGITADQREKTYMPDVPTFKEQGYDYVTSVWYGIQAPKGTPPEVVKKLEDAFKQAMDDPTVKDAWAKLSLLPGYMGSADYQKQITTDATANAQAAKDLNLAAK